MRIKKAIFFILVVSLAIGFGLLIGKWIDNRALAGVETYEELKVFTEVLSLVQKNYVEEVKPKDLVFGAIKGMLSNLDPHSAFMPPDIYKEMQVDTKGEFGGIGVQIGVKNNQLMVIAPIEDTPAARAGIRAGDYIIKINEESTKDMNLEDAVKKMRGAKGTQLTLTILRPGSTEPMVFTLTRDIIKIQSVKSQMRENKIGYIRIAQFQEQTTEDLKKAVKKLEGEQMESLILDLRNNPGGLLNMAVGVSEQFLESGKLIVSIRDRIGEIEEVVSKNGDIKKAYPMIVLVNEGSASASEIVAGALQDWGRAVILGATTFGKGSVQTVIPLTDGSGLRLTTAKYYTPKGRSIQNTGIIPDIEVKTATVKEAAKEQHPTIREKDLPRHLEERQKLEEKQKEEQRGGAVAEEEKEKEDPQLQKAIDLLTTWKVFKKNYKEN